MEEHPLGGSIPGSSGSSGGSGVANIPDLTLNPMDIPSSNDNPLVSDSDQIQIQADPQVLLEDFEVPPNEPQIELLVPPIAFPDQPLIGFLEQEQNGHIDGVVVDSDSDNDDSNGDPNENVQNDYVYNEEDQWDVQSDGSHSTERISRDGDGSEEGDPPPQFDPELPARHMYLGEAMEELQGRVVLEEGSTLEIPIVVMNFHLIPGQTLPMTVFHAVFQNAIRRCILNDRVFGVVNSVTENVDGRNVVSRQAIGTVAEIYEFQEESDQPMNPVDLPLLHMGTNFALKAKGRQRFNIVDVRRQADGNLMAKIKIRPERRLTHFMSRIASNDTFRFQFPYFVPDNYSGMKSMCDECCVDRSKEEMTEHGSMENGVGTSECERKACGIAKIKASIRRWRPVTKFYSSLTSWPSFVYENYDEDILVHRIHQKLENELKGLTESNTNVPLDPTELSFWLAQNLTMDDAIRLEILKMDSPVQRLRFELNLLETVSRVITCRRCLVTIADQADIFAMSTEGPQGTYVNPNGYIHETLTVHRVRDMITRGAPSTEASWFQGYSWTVVECLGCRQHLGWKFQALDRLKPKRFWGLARKSVAFKYDFTSAGGSEMSGAEQLASSNRMVTVPMLPLPFS